MCQVQGIRSSPEKRIKGGILISEELIIFWRKRQVLGLAVIWLNSLLFRIILKNLRLGMELGEKRI